MIRGTTLLLGFSIKMYTKHNKGTTLCWGGGVKGEVVPGPLFYTFLFLHPSLTLLQLHNVTAFSSFASPFLYSKFDPYSFAPFREFFQQSLMAFFMRISKLFSKKVRLDAVSHNYRSKSTHFLSRSFNNMVFG